MIVVVSVYSRTSLPGSISVEKQVDLHPSVELFPIALSHHSQEVSGLPILCIRSLSALRPSAGSTHALPSRVLINVHYNPFFNFFLSNPCVFLLS